MQKNYTFTGIYLQAMLKLIAVPLMLLAVSYAPAQVTFQKGDSASTGTEHFQSIKQTTDGGYILLRKSSFERLEKADANGINQWRKRYSAQPSLIYLNAISQTSDGGYVVAGTQFYVSGNSTSDFLVIKTDANGDTMWVKRFGTSNKDNASSIYQTTDGGFIIAGHSYGTTDTAMYVVKTDSVGVITWAKTYGGTATEGVRAVKQTSDGGFIIAGETFSFGAGNRDMYVVKTDAAGNEQWSKTYGGTASDLLQGIEQTTDGGYIIAGETQSFGSGAVDAYLLKTDGSGVLVWSKTFGGSADDRAYDVKQTTDGGYIVAGQTVSYGAGSMDVFLIKTDATGNMLWSKAIGGAAIEVAYSVMQTSDGGYVMGGTSSSFIASSIGTYFVKADATGNSGCNTNAITPLVTNPATTAISPATTVNASIASDTNVTVSIFSTNNNYKVFCSATGLNEAESEINFSVNPNPANQFVTISLQSAELINTEIKIVDAVGKLIQQLRIENSTVEIDVSKFDNGIYFIQYYLNSEKTVTKLQKLIIQH